MEKLRILVYSDYINHKSGYARCFNDILPHFKRAGHEVAHVALGWNGFPINMEMKTYHTRTPDVKDYFAPEVLHYAIDDFDPDIVLTIQDYWMLHKISFELAHPGKLKWFHWGTLDSDPMPHKARESARWVHCHLYFSEFARTEMLAIHPQTHGDVVYPSVNPKTFFEMDKKKLRSDFNLDKHKVVVCCARNQIRKNIPILLDAMQYVLKEIPNAALIIASSIDAKTDTYEPAGYDLYRFIDERDLQDHVIFPRTTDNKPISDEVLNVQYNLGDINVLSSVGEGFGLSYTEAGISSIPSVGVDCAATTEVVKGRGLLVKPSAYQYNQVGGKYYMVNPKDLADNIVKLLTDDKAREGFGKEAKKFAKTLTPKSRAEQMLELFEKSIKGDWKCLAKR